jgi:hypothetical protein
MVYEAPNLSDRDFQFLRDRLVHLNNEVTRYRDTEWKATAFHAAVLAAVTYVLLDKSKCPDLSGWRTVLTVVVLAYTGLACSQLVYIHRRLNERRNERADLLGRLGESGPAKIETLWGLYEGPGFIFFAGFTLSLVALTTALVAFVWRSQ